jgi:hypothetical protein
VIRLTVVQGDHLLSTHGKTTVYHLGLKELRAVADEKVGGPRAKEDPPAETFFSTKVSQEQDFIFIGRGAAYGFPTNLRETSVTALT